MEPDAIDPHARHFGSNKNLMPNLFEAPNAQDRLVPGLALSWRFIDDLTWEFRLRDNMTISAGTKSTADDVAFTINRALHVPATVVGMSEYIKPTDRVEIVDPLTVRFHTKTPFPLAPSIPASSASSPAASSDPRACTPRRMPPERRFDNAATASLNCIGHNINRWRDWKWRAVCAIAKDAAANLLEGGAGVRRPLGVRGW